MICIALESIQNTMENKKCVCIYREIEIERERELEREGGGVKSSSDSYDFRHARKAN